MKMEAALFSKHHIARCKTRKNTHYIFVAMKTSNLACYQFIS